MDKIFHPVNGQQGYFCSVQEKIVIDAILHDYSVNQQVLEDSSRSNVRGGQL